MQHNKLWTVFRFVIALSLFSFLHTGSVAQVSGLPPIKIVQLGDSYSAGNGARSEAGARNYYSVEGCYRSPTNWGSQFAASLKDTFAVTYINRACSGGVVADIQHERDMKDSDFKNINGNCPTPAYPDEEYYKDTSLLKCSRFVEPQIDGIDNSVDLVLMSMGGNDLGFATIVTDCFSPLRSPDGCKKAVEDANKGITGLKDNLINTFAAIRAKLKPGARIAYVAYPNLLMDGEYKISRWTGTWFENTYDAGTAIRDLSLLGEKTQKEAVDKANADAGENYIVFYDGTKELFKGHEPNPDPNVANPARWINEFEGSLLVEINRLEAYHPNPLGHENWGEALSIFETFGASGGSFSTDADIDVAFVVDTTGSMGGEIAQVRTDLASLVAQLDAATDSYRVAVVSYRDFPDRTSIVTDYPSRVDQTFTDDLGLIQAGIDSLYAYGGGDWQETVYSGIQSAIDLPWRPGVTKVMIVIGDAPALSPEPTTGLTPAQIVANSIAVDPVQVVGVDVSGLNSYGDMSEIATGTGGSIVSGTTNLTTKISEILDTAAHQPFAWIGSAYSGKIGEAVQFDASGSFDPSGVPLTLYEWDFDGDGIYDLQTEEPTATHVYDTSFDGFVIVRVTGEGGTALASARIQVNDEGFVAQGNGETCPLDENGYSILVDEEGRFLPCTADSIPEYGYNGVVQLSENYIPSIFSK